MAGVQQGEARPLDDLRHCSCLIGSKLCLGQKLVDLKHRLIAHPEQRLHRSDRT